MNTLNAYVDTNEVLNSPVSRMMSMGIHNANDGMLLADKQGKILYVNAAYEQLAGFACHELVGMRVKDVVKDGLYEQQNYPSAIDHGKVVSHIKVFNKTKTRVMITCKPVFDNGNSNIEVVVSNVRNIDEMGRTAGLLMTRDSILNTYDGLLHGAGGKSAFDKGISSYSPEMKSIADKIAKISKFNVDVLLEGETGTGKTTLAKLIYKESQKNGKGRFVEVNCGAIPHNLIESELFGYERGAFTGASNSGKKGLFEEANNGIIFLDEIEELGADIQAKLLSVLQERQIRRVGSVESKTLEFQVVAASNKPLEEMVKQGKFRQDLYYRLNVVRIKVPALRERREDIVLLANNYLEQYNQAFQTTKKFAQDVLSGFVAYDWPGNIRELANLIKSMVIISNDDIIQVKDLPDHMQSSAFGHNAIVTNLTNISLENLVAELESEIICRSLQKNGSLRKAAQALQINPSSLYRRMIKYNIHLPGGMDSKNA